MGGKPSKSACKIRGIRIIGVENPSHSVQIIMKFTINPYTFNLDLEGANDKHKTPHRYQGKPISYP